MVRQPAQRLPLVCPERHFHPRERRNALLRDVAKPGIAIPGSDDRNTEPAECIFGLGIRCPRI